VALKGILFVLRTGIPWEYLPREMGCSGMTCWRRLRDWQEAGAWERIRRKLLGELHAANLIDWSRAVVDSASLRALKGGRIRAPIPRTALGVARNTTFSPMPTGSRWRSRSPRRTVTT
jgi:transposase